jgi:hypothetical protein
MKKLLFILIFIAILLLLNYLGMQFAENLNLPVWPKYSDITNTTVILVFLLFVVFMSVPFVPGMEIGLTLMFVLGKEGIILVYFGTIFALTFSFLIGRFIPAKLIIGVFKFFKLKKAYDLVSKLEQLKPEEKLIFLESLHSKFLPKILKHRYILTGILLNTPGNSLIGGGGGIGLIAGMSGLFNIYYYVFTISLAISPIPLLLWFGIISS